MPAETPSGRGPPGTSAPTKDTREHRVPRQPCYYGRARRPRRAAHTRTPAETPSGRGPSGTSVPTRVHGNTRCRMMANMLLLVGCDVPGAPRTRGRQRRRQRGRGPPGTSAPTRDTREHKVPYDDVMRHHWNMFIFAGIKPRSTEQDLPSTTSDRVIGICPSFHFKRKTSWNPCASSIKSSMIY